MIPDSSRHSLQKSSIIENSVWCHQELTALPTDEICSSGRSERNMKLRISHSIWVKQREDDH